MELGYINRLSGFTGYNTAIPPKAKETPFKNEQRNENFAPLPSTNQFLAFTGGYSMSLKQTLENLPDDVFPPDIKRLAQEELDKGNPDKKTLVGIHKSKYGKINQMTSLEEVKAEFPEFKNVLSDSEVKVTKGSFIDDVRNDRLEWFDSDDDLALQLLQMYWADAFSTSDLEQFTGGKDITSVLRSYHIDRMNPYYAHVLKLSDENYNKDFSDTMSKKMTGVQRARQEKKDGVYIPRGPVSKETRDKISDSLVKYYSEHPERLAEMSARMKQYYKEHPEEKERLTLIITKAWDLREAKPVRKKMSKFIGKPDISAADFAKMSLSEDEVPKKTLKDFWKRNPWAKDQWSKAMKQAWKIYREKGLDGLKIKENKPKEAPQTTPVSKDTPALEPDGSEDLPIANYDDFIYEFPLYSTKMKESMRKWFKKRGYDVAKIEKGFTARLYDDNVRPPAADEYAANAINKYFEIEAHGNTLADVYQISMLNSMGDMMDKLSEEHPSMQNAFTVLAAVIYLGDGLLNSQNLPKVLDSNDAMQLYLRCACILAKSGNSDYAKVMENNLDKAHDVLLRRDNAEIIKTTSRAASVRNIARELGEQYAVKVTMPPS